jgi:hypothetical protein
MIDLDSLIDAAVVSGELADGVPPSWLSRNYDPRLVTALSGGYNQTGKLLLWTEAEEAFLRENTGEIPITELARILDRSVDAIKIHRKRHLNISGDTTIHETGQDVARILGLSCSKAVTKWINRGILPGKSISTARPIYAVKRDDLRRFALTPDNWVYFNPERIADPGLRRLVLIRKARWGDEWWTTGQVAAHHGVDSRTIVQCIYRGALPGKRWANWRVKRSDALRLRLLLPGVYRDTRWTDRGDAFLLTAFAVGLSISDVDRLIGRENVHSRTYRRAQFYLDRLKKTGKISQVIQKYKLPIRYDPERKLLLADWRDHSDKFPRLALAVDRFWTRTASKGDLRKVSGILAAWANWYARMDDQREFARKLITYSNPSWQGLLDRYWAIRDWGVDPLVRGNVLEEEQNDDRQ